jgi:hypothetical protein
MHLYENLFQAAGIHNIDALGTDSLTRTGRVRDVICFRHNIDAAAAPILTSTINYLPARALIGRAAKNAVIIDDDPWTVHNAKARKSGQSQYRTSLHAAIPFGHLPASLTFITVYGDIIVWQIRSTCG